MNTREFVYKRIDGLPACCQPDLSECGRAASAALARLAHTRFEAILRVSPAGSMDWEAALQ